MEQRDGERVEWKVREIERDIVDKKIRKTHTHTNRERERERISIHKREVIGKEKVRIVKRRTKR